MPGIVTSGSLLSLDFQEAFFDETTGCPIKAKTTTKTTFARLLACLLQPRGRQGHHFDERERLTIQACPIAHSRKGISKAPELAINDGLAR